MTFIDCLSLFKISSDPKPKKFSWQFKANLIGHRLEAASAKVLELPKQPDKAKSQESQDLGYFSVSSPLNWPALIQLTKLFSV